MFWGWDLLAMSRGLQGQTPGTSNHLAPQGFKQLGAPLKRQNVVQRLHRAAQSTGITLDNTAAFSTTLRAISLNLVPDHHRDADRLVNDRREREERKHLAGQLALWTDWPVHDESCLPGNVGVSARWWKLSAPLDETACSVLSLIWQSRLI